MAKEPFIDKVIRFLEKLAWHFGIPPSEDSSLVNGNKGNPKNKKAKNRVNNNPNMDNKDIPEKSRANNPNKTPKNTSLDKENSNVKEKKETKLKEKEKVSQEPINNIVDESIDEPKANSSVDELLNNDISLKEIATVKELQSLDVNHMNLPTFVGDDSNRFHFDLNRFDLDNFVALLFFMLFNKKEEYTLHYTDKKMPLTEEERAVILHTILDAFDEVHGKFIEYFSGIKSVNVISNGEINGYTGYFTWLDITVKFTPNYKSGFEDTFKMLKLCRYVKSKLVEKNKINKNMSQYEIAKVLFNWVVLHTDYDMDKSENGQRYSGYYAIIKGKAVCQGYTAMYNALCRCCGIKVYGMSGISVGRDTGGYENHIWTVVQTKNKEMFVDSTWGSPVIKNKNDLKKQGIPVENFCDFQWFDTPYNEFIKTHNWDKKMYPI